MKAANIADRCLEITVKLFSHWLVRFNLIKILNIMADAFNCQLNQDGSESEHTSVTGSLLIGLPAAY
jgi:hypothetical protein